MDGTSPGGMPVAIGGATQWWNPETGHWQKSMPAPSIACAAVIPQPFLPSTALVPSGHYTFPQPAPLTDAEVDRIARRVVELLEARKP